MVSMAGGEFGMLLTSTPSMRGVKSWYRADEALDQVSRYARGGRAGIRSVASDAAGQGRSQE